VGDQASFEIQIYSTESEWKKLNPTRVLDGYEELSDAIEEAQLWREAYQVVVIARGEDNDYEPGECIFDLRESKKVELE
jgi:hypothetical protein